VDECAEAGFLRLAPPVLTFRHELVRQAVLTTIGAAQRQDLAAQVLSTWRRQSRLGGPPAPLARLAELAEDADDRARVLEYAPAAALEAAELGSHREAAAQYIRLLRFVDEPAERAALLEPLSVEQYLTGDLLGAIRSREQALTRRRGEQNLLAIGDDLRWLSRLHWYAGHRAEAERAEIESLSVLSALGPSAELAMAMSTRSQYLMLSGAHTEAVSRGNRAIELATELELPDVLSHASNNVGSSRMSMGERAGLEQVRESLRLALQINAEDHAARAYVNLAFMLVSIRELDEALAVLEDALAYCLSHDLGLQSPYLRASRALIHTYAGRWAEADAEAGRLLAGPASSPIHRFVALVPLAAVRMRTGASPAEVTGWLDELGRLARQLGDGQRLVPYAVLRAEAAWLTGTDVSGDAELLEIYAKERAGSSWVELTELTFWLHRAGLPVEPPPVAAGPLRDWLTDPQATADRLLALGCGYEAAVCLLGGSEAAVRRALQIFADLGAPPALALAQAELRARGAVQIPRGPRAPTRNHPFGLTARQHEVLELIGERLSNAEIAARLVLSERTVGHHVSAILAKLEVTTRDQAAHRLSALRP
jgi:DNA-binding CsgD family transcriptional regulator/tetratricopeptide (TPR) repeat protein